MFEQLFKSDPFLPLVLFPSKSIDNANVKFCSKRLSIAFAFLLMLIVA